MRRTWTWTFDLPPDRLWPLLADTEPVQRGDGPAAVHARADTATKWDGLSSRARQGCGLHARMGGEAVRVDRRSALPPVAVVHERPISPLRPGVRSRVRRQRRFARNLRTRMGAVECGRPCVRRAARGAGGRGGRQAHPGGRRVRARGLRGRAPHAVRVAATRTAAGRTRAGRDAGPRDRPQPVRQRPRRTARRHCA